MRDHSSTTPPLGTIPVHKGVVILSGYGLKVDIQHGQLHAQDGLGAARRAARFGKATARISRLVILGHTGSVSLSALRWLHDAKVGVIHIGADGDVVLASSPANERMSALRRAQAIARDGETGLRITAKLIGEKLKGEARVADMIDAGRGGKIAKFAEALGELTTMEGLRTAERLAAASYWKIWTNISLNFARRDLPKVPEYWLHFGTRVSPLTSSPRNAANPANAMLNYLYAILEAETRIALLTIGLDPGLGLMHADQPGRDSLACDVMEAVRPQVDEWLLDYLGKKTFAAKDLFELADGGVRLTRSLTHELAQTAPLWARAVGPIAESVAADLVSGARRRQTTAGQACERHLPTKLTQTNRSAGRASYRRPGESTRRRRGVALLKVCPECGNPVRGGKNRFCSVSCWEAYKHKVVMPRWSKAGIRALADSRAKGIDLSHGGAVAKRRGATNARRALERRKWGAKNTASSSDVRRFKKEILPKLADVPLSRIMRATGLSKRYSSLIRRGLYLPHPMHFSALARAVLLS